MVTQAKERWGKAKLDYLELHQCPECGARFDLPDCPASCPKCGTERRELQRRLTGVDRVTVELLYASHGDDAGVLAHLPESCPACYGQGKRYVVAEVVGEIASARVLAWNEQDQCPECSGSGRLAHGDNMGAFLFDVRELGFKSVASRWCPDLSCHPERCDCADLGFACQDAVTPSAGNPVRRAPINP